MLRDTYEVDDGAADVEVKQDGRLIARLRTPESALARFAEAHAGDGLRALGPIHDDSTGVTAALGLLSVHIEELVATADDVPIDLEVTAAGVQVRGSALSP